MVTTTITYIVYTVLSIALTIWVGRTLFSNGRIFIVDSFNGNIEMADAVNKLLLVGFYLINIGFVSFYLKYGDQPENLIQAIEYISSKVGVVSLVLGGMHYLNMRNIAKMRSKALRKPRLEPEEPVMPAVPEEKLAASGD
jgi:hypothetical protein